MTLIPPPSTLPHGSTVWAYLRDSGGEGQDRSVERQRQSLQAYTNQHNLILARIYQDVAKTGTTTAGREDFQHMISDTRDPNQRPHGILLWNFARFARNTDDGIYHKAVLRNRGIIIHSLTDPIPEGPYARLIETMIETANEEKSRQTSVDVKASLAAMVQQGAVPGKAPVGIQRTPIQTINPRTGKKRTQHRWDPNPEYQHRIKKAFQMLVAGATLREIQQETQLYKSVTDYNRFFQNKIYIGTLVYGKITIENYCAPTIDKKLWDDTQRIIKSRAQGKHLRSKITHPRTKNGSYLLTGLLRCKECDAALVGMSSPQRNGRTYRRYQCVTAKTTRGAECKQKPIPAEHLEETIINDIRSYISDPTNMKDMLLVALDKSAKHNDEIEGKLKTLKTETSKNKRAVTNIVAAIAAAGHNDILLNELDKLQFEQNDLRSKIIRLENSKNAPAPTLTQLQIKTHVKKLTTLLESKDPVKLRRVLLGITEKIIVNRENTKLTIVPVFYQKTPIATPESLDDAKDDAIITVSLFPAPVEVQSKKAAK